MERKEVHSGISPLTELAHHERITDPTFRRAVSLIDSGDGRGLSLLLEQEPGLLHDRVLFEGGNYFRNPGLLEFIAENPVRHGTLPANIVEIAELLLQAGPEPSARNETLGLVASGRVPRECKVQLPLIELLCTYGADPNTALKTAAVHGELDAVRHLLRMGAKADLPVLAALGETKSFLQQLSSANAGQRHLAFALAARSGHLGIVRALLDAGEDPDRYNPVGAHSHSTPLHEAAFAGHLSVVKLLVERGAKLDIRDVLWAGTPADWAQYSEKPEVEAYVRNPSESARQQR